MVVTLINLRIFLLYFLFFIKKNIVMMQVIIVPRVKLILVIFNLIPLFENLI